jgi:hypothetical protein
MAHQEKNIVGNVPPQRKGRSKKKRNKRGSKSEN